MRALLALLLSILPLGAAAQQESLIEDVVGALSTYRVSISAGFDGSEILIFGAVKRTGPTTGDNMGVIVTVEGPTRELTVRKKAKVGPIWVNTESVVIDEAPSFYAVNSSAPLDRILNNVDDLRHGITVRQAIRSVGAPPDVSDPIAFTDALVRIREAADLYQTNDSAIRIREATLFDTTVQLPANLVDGNYSARIFLTREGRVVAQSLSTINVEKVGLERFLYGLAHEQALVYGLMSLAIAIAAGWGASAAFRYLQS